MNVYMFPINDPDKSNTKNPYISNLVSALEEENCIIINKNKVQKYGIFDILLSIKKTDIYYLNWIENLPDRRFGKIQCILFYFIFFLLKVFRKKVVWMMHNKVSHSKKGLFCKILTTYMLVNYSDVILTHAKDGISFGNNFLKYKKQIHFLHHPIKDRLNILDDSNPKQYDILIWGSISPYKGIESFLQHLEKQDTLRKYNICIAGKVSDTQLANDLEKYSNNNIKIINDYISFKSLEKLFSKSKIVLFTYAGYSTLSSGALMDTLSYANKVIGPDVGVFRELNKEGLIETYQNFDDLLLTINQLITKDVVPLKRISKFIKENSWLNFGKNICKIIENHKRD